RGRCGAGNVTWHGVVSGDNWGLERDARWLQPLDDRIWRRTDLLPGLASRLRVPDLVYSIVLHFRRDLVPRPLTGWADFFDPAAVPGRRVTYDNVEYGLFEPGRRPAGGPLGDPYPLDPHGPLRARDRFRGELILARDLERGSPLRLRGASVGAL